MTRRSRNRLAPAIDRLEERRTPSLTPGFPGDLGLPTDFSSALPPDLPPIPPAGLPPGLPSGLPPGLPSGLPPDLSPGLPPGSSPGLPGSLQPQLSTTPADGSTLAADAAPSSLVFHMGGPADLLWFDYNVELRQVAADGSEATVVSRYGWAPAAVSGDDATLALPTTLAPGRYRIVLVGGTIMAATYSQGGWDPSKDHAIAEFVVKPAAAATDLGVVGPNVASASGTLDGSTVSESFRFHLAEGTDLWRLSAHVDAARIGSGLIAGLAVYDASGRQVASGAVASGLATDFPNDPFLFAGLAPGDYVVTVSRTADAAGGAFRLELTATSADAPTRVTSFAPDPATASFSIAFSEPIDPARLRSDAVVAVDASGRTYPVELTSVGAGQTSARFRFVAPPPAGDYRLTVAAVGPLTDLIGRVPVADGLPAGTLAAWTVTAADALQAEAAGPAAPPRGGTVAAGALDLAPGSAVDVPVTLGADGSLVLTVVPSSGRFRVEVVGADGVHVVDDGSDPGPRQVWIRPGTGSFVIRIVAVGDARLAGSWVLAGAVASEESLTARPVGGGGGAIEVGLGEPADASRSSSSRGPAAPLTAAAGRFEAGPSPWALGAGSAPVGRPSATDDAVAPTAAAAPGGLPLVAWAGPGAATSAARLALSARGADDGAPRSPAGFPETEPRAAIDEAVARAAAEADADAGALRRAEAVAEGLLGGLQRLFDRPDATPNAPAAADDVDAAALAAAEAVAPPPQAADGKVQRSTLDLPFAALFVTASTIHLRRTARRWWRKRKITRHATLSDQPSIPRPLFRGPRFMTPARSTGRPVAPRRG